MSFLGYKQLRVTEVVKPGGWRVLLKEPRIAELAESIKRDGNFAPPIIRKSDKSIVCGHDRLAAIDSLRAEWFEARLWDGSDEERDRVRRDENRLRRSFSDSEKAAMRTAFEASVANIRNVPEYSKSAESDDSDPEPTRGRGRPKTPEREAIRRVAAKHGASERAVADVVKSSPPKPVGPQMTYAALALQGYLVSARTALGRAMASVTDALKSVPAAYADHADLALLHRQLKHASTALKMATPERLCPYCKAQKPHMKDCPACKGLSYLTPAQGGDVPKELLVSGDGAGIFVADTFVRLTDL